MNAKNQKPNLSPEKIYSTSFLIWIISGLHLLPMLWLLLSTMVVNGAHETKPWLVPTVAVLTVSYGILMLLLWPHEKVSPRSTSEIRSSPLRGLNKSDINVSFDFSGHQSAPAGCRN